MLPKGDIDHSVYMRRALELASCGAGLTRPNPLVGSVIVHNGRIIGEGYHIKAGTPHAEVHAVNSVADVSLLRSSTIYVTLEPCSHYGKTPPCAELIIASGIPRVVAGTTDTSAKVSGRGFDMLREAGVEVITGVEEAACRHINRRFFTFHEKKRPWVVLKWAESADGFIDIVRTPGDDSGPNWISGMPERVLVHRWRAEEDAIMAGGQTIRSDNPMLNVRLWSGLNPVRIIVSKAAKMDTHLHVFNNEGRVLLFTADENTSFPDVETFIIKDDKIPVRKILDCLYDQGIQSVIIEGGAVLLQTFIDSGMWDEARVFKGKQKFGSGIPAPEIRGRQERLTAFDQSTLRILSPELPENMMI